MSIHEHPEEGQGRTVPGHWEADLITGSRTTHVATLVERTSRYVILVTVDGTHTVSVNRALTRRIRTLPTDPARVLDLGLQVWRWPTTSTSR